MKKTLLFITVFLLIIGGLLFTPNSVFAKNGPSDGYCYIFFKTGSTKKYVFITNSTNNNAQKGATYDKSTNTLTLKNIQDKSLHLDVNEMGDDFKLKLEGTNYLQSITVWGYGYGGCLNIIGDGRLDVYAGNYTNAITVYAEKSLGEVKISEESTVNLYAKKNVIAIFDTTGGVPLKGINLPNTTSVTNKKTGFVETNSARLSDGKIITVVEKTNFVDVYQNVTALKPNENGYTNTYTLLKNSKDPNGIYGGIHYESITQSGVIYEDVWGIWKFVKVGENYCATSGEWERYDIVENKNLSSKGYTNTDITFSTSYYSGIESVEVAKDSKGIKYGLRESTIYLNGVEQKNYYVFNIGKTVSIDGQNVYVLTSNTSVDGTKLEKVWEKAYVYHDYSLPVTSLNIKPIAKVENISEGTISVSSKYERYTGKEIQPKVTVKLNKKTLKKDKDYTIKYTNNKKIGTATVTVTGTGAYEGTLKENFEIVAKNAKKLSKVTTKLSQSEVIYNGKKQKVKVELKDGKKTLKEKKDYTVKYINNDKIGTAKIEITGKGNYCDTITKKFKIVKKDISKVSIKVSTKDENYTGSKINKVVTIKDGKTTLKENVDYKVSYSNNIKPGKATITIKGKGNYKGKVKKTFKIIQKNIGAPKNLKVTGQDKNSISFEWKKINGVTGYQVYKYNVKSKKWELASITNKTKATISNLSSGETVSVKVCGYIKTENQELKGEFSSELKGATVPNKPKITFLGDTGNKNTKQLKLEWTKINNATGYEVKIYTGKSKTWSTVETANNMRITSGMVKEKYVYKYKVRSYVKVNGKKIYSDYSSEVSINY